MICDSGLDVKVLATGSGGNATLLQDCILIDCGVPYKYISRHVDKIGLVLISHKHRDHLHQETVRRLAWNRPLVRFAVGDFLVPTLLNLGISGDRIDVLKPRMAKDYGGVMVEPVPLNHDVPNYGFRIGVGDKRVFYATDTADLSGINCPGYDLYMVEANYDEAEILERIAEHEAAGEYVPEYRTMRTHLSQQQADDWLVRMTGPNSEWMYMHGHGGKEVAEA